MKRFIGDWMEKESITPTEEEAIDLYLVVEDAPYEFDYTCDDILKVAGKRGLNEIDIEFKAILKRSEMVA